jgi:cob(I)alamin adenosyltransferase
VVKIYTKTGDDGTTGLLYGGRVGKDSVVMQINGRWTRPRRPWAWPEPRPSPGSSSTACLTALERELYVLMAEVATTRPNRPSSSRGKTLVTAEMVDRPRAASTS